jgi:xanthine dehydrogenase YagT iron-sulfur-binding subunit
MDIDTPDDYERLQRAEEAVSRREFVGAALVGGALMSVTSVEAQTQSAPATYKLNINGQDHELKLDTRTTLLDLLREQIHLTGTKKGCDHGQCGACTVLVNERRVNSCLTLAVACEGERVTTIEGLGDPEHLHTMQAAFLEHDGFQCGYCTSGQICSAVAVLEEARAGAASAVTADVRKLGPVELTDAEVRERMSGNICRCGAYPNIVAAVRYAATHPEPRRTG